MANITSVRGFRDILPDETPKWQGIEEKIREIFFNFGIHELRIPVLEKTELFKRGIGEATDIVEKEMYTFLDRGNEYLTMRPEATASVIRAYIEHNIYEKDPIAKLFTIGPMFRRERPQKGRFRQFHQINVEFLGQEDPHIDAELMSMLMHLLSEVGLDSLKLEINSLGCDKCRPAFRERLTGFLKDKKEDLCEDCRRRLITNPLRIFDCKNESCQEIISGAPVTLDFICGECKTHFEKVKEYLGTLHVPFIINTRMVRGLDYYTRTAFEITAESLGAQNAVTGGGRYDGLVQMLGGPDISGIGFAIGFDRLISMIPGRDTEYTGRPSIFIAALGDQAQGFAFSLCNTLRLAGIRAEMDFSNRSLKSQMKRSNKLNCSHTLIIGEKEIEAGTAQLRDMADGTQKSVDINDVASIVLGVGGKKFETLNVEPENCNL
ncbi:MAG: histidine--tRNA ligase [Thermodesulfobacteriota bacterium]|nr:histidine--tRNA ligase [Thermodesulfobacteriota bacterium]